MYNIGLEKFQLPHKPACYALAEKTRAVQKSRVENMKFRRKPVPKAFGKVGEKARDAAGYVGGTQLSRIANMQPPSVNSSGVRGVQYDKRAKKFRARLKFKGKLMNFGSYEKFEDAVAARKAAELEY
jgi:hypothetical protein